MNEVQIATLIISSASAVAAAIAAWSSWRAVEEMRNSRLDEFRPILKWGGNQSNPDDQDALTFNIKNQGKGPAYNIFLVDSVGGFIKAQLTEGSILEDKSEGFVNISDSRIFERLLNSNKIIIRYEDVYQRVFETHVSLSIEKEDGKWIKSVNGDFRQVIKSH